FLPEIGIICSRITAWSMKAFGGTVTKRAALKFALTFGSSHDAACGTRAFIAVHLDNAASMDGLSRSASPMTLARVKLRVSTASAFSAAQPRFAKQVVNKSAG